MNIVIRADASYSIGTGHVMRCLTLAHELKKSGGKVRFFCRQEGGHMMEQIKKEGFPVESLSTYTGKEDFEAMKPWLEKEDIHWLIVDHYQYEMQDETLFRPYVKKILVIDDLANRPHDCDVLLDQNRPYSVVQPYNQLLPLQAKVCLGTPYVLLRKSFYEQPRRKRKGTIKRILLFFGGSDPTCETEKGIFSIIGLEEYVRGEIVVDVVVGKSNPKRHHLSNLCSVFPHMYYHEQVSNMAELMEKADIMIGAGGTTTWERCYLGLPALTISVAMNQYYINELVHQSGGHIHLGWYYEVEIESIKEQLGELMKNSEMVLEMSLNGLDMMKGHKCGKLMSVMEEVLKE